MEPERQKEFEFAKDAIKAAKDAGDTAEALEQWIKQLPS
jgi:hypothetical protein